MRTRTPFSVSLRPFRSIVRGWSNRFARRRGSVSEHVLAARAVRPLGLRWWRSARRHREPERRLARAPQTALRPFLVRNLHSVVHYHSSTFAAALQSRRFEQPVRALRVFIHAASPLRAGTFSTPSEVVRGEPMTRAAVSFNVASAAASARMLHRGTAALREPMSSVRARPWLGDHAHPQPLARAGAVAQMTSLGLRAADVTLGHRSSLTRGRTDRVHVQRASALLVRMSGRSAAQLQQRPGEAPAALQRWARAVRSRAHGARASEPYAPSTGRLQRLVGSVVRASEPPAHSNAPQSHAQRTHAHVHLQRALTIDAAQASLSAPFAQPAAAAPAMRIGRRSTATTLAHWPASAVQSTASAQAQTFGPVARSSPRFELAARALRTPHSSLASTRASRNASSRATSASRRATASELPKVIQPEVSLRWRAAPSSEPSSAHRSELPLTAAGRALATRAPAPTVGGVPAASSQAPAHSGVPRPHVLANPTLQPTFDVERLANEVMQRIDRRLRIERERRGLR
jgi:hypothetical protein